MPESDYVTVPDDEWVRIGPFMVKQWSGGEAHVRLTERGLLDLDPLGRTDSIDIHWLVRWLDRGRPLE